jgi:hypothetical protein
MAAVDGDLYFDHNFHDLFVEAGGCFVFLSCCYYGREDKEHGVNNNGFTELARRMKDEIHDDVVVMVVVMALKYADVT